MQKSDFKYDVVVIGSGPGGEGAAMQAAKGNKSVAVVERYNQVGGACTHVGTIPSKSLGHSVHVLWQLRENPALTLNDNSISKDYRLFLRNAESVIQKQVAMRRSFYSRNGIDVIEGKASFIDEHSVQILLADGSITQIRADYFVIATGSRPYHPPDVNFNHPRIKDSDTILDLDFTPKSITVYGAGVIGCEYASIFRSSGLKVNLVNTRTRLLEFLDAEISDALSYHFRDQAMLVRNDEQYSHIETNSDEVILHLKSQKKLKSDILLWANGRTGNVQELALENLNISADDRGRISINECYQTALPHIYAVGDVIGYPALASAAYNQGRFAAYHIIHSQADFELIRDIPTGIYTNPEISSIGKTETQLTEEKIPYEVGHAFFRNLARAQITGVTAGILKILFHRESLQLLGVHCFGYQATEIIHIGQMVMAQPGTGNNLKAFVNATFNYPTMAEAYRVAALNGLNRIF